MQSRLACRLTCSQFVCVCSSKALFTKVRARLAPAPPPFILHLQRRAMGWDGEADVYRVFTTFQGTVLVPSYMIFHLVITEITVWKV